MPDLLIELLSEEIPARMQRKASLDLEKLFTDGISELGLTYESSAAFSTPRRLTLALENVSNKSLSSVEEKRGPRNCLLYTSPSPRDSGQSRMPSSA